MYSGWVVKWRLDRPLAQQEINDRLLHQRQAADDMDDRGALVSFNSTFAEFIDRRFRLRGGFGTMLCLLLGLASIGFIVFIWVDLNFYNTADFLGLLFLTSVTLASAWFYWWVILGRDFFTYTHYPIRFNRKTRCVYVFRSERDGGILTVPWESGYFHIGQGIRDKRLLDVRCHILEGETIKDTFPTGHFYLHKETVQQLWEFIRAYMEEGPAAFQETVIVTSPATSWHNCFIMASASMGAGSIPAIVLLSPFIGLITLTRWLVMKSCKEPQWPAEIEAACQIDQNDPYRLPEPTYIGQLSQSDEAYAKLLSKHKNDTK